MTTEVEFPLDVDLGQLIPRHHVVLTGMDFGEVVEVSRLHAEIKALMAERLAKVRNGESHEGLGVSVTWRTPTSRDREVVSTHATEPSLHYKFVPGIEPSEEEGNNVFFWHWMLSATDDVGTLYRDDNGGTRAPAAGGAATHATQDIGGHIPNDASRLTLRFAPPPGWEPPEPWRRELQLDLVERRVVD